MGGFRPFAPAVLSEETPNFFENNNLNSYMMIVSQIKDELKENKQELELKKGFEKLKLEDQLFKQLLM